ncbi:MAG: hypothetical protein M0Z78_08890 [Betaproteobacteria bacterium]|nr:hypothetical protein [Betaproteobacteria bacterium]
MLRKIEQVVRKQFGNLNDDDVSDITSEAWTLQFIRYGDALGDKSQQHIKTMILEASRNMGYLNKKVNCGTNGSDKVVIKHRSFETMQEATGFDPSAEDAPERPEFVVARILELLPESDLKSVFALLLEEHADSIESASTAMNLTPQRVFDALRKIGELINSYEGHMYEGLFILKIDDFGLRKAVIKVCDTLFPRIASNVCSWEQGILIS